MQWICCRNLVCWKIMVLNVTPCKQDYTGPSDYRPPITNTHFPPPMTQTHTQHADWKHRTSSSVFDWPSEQNLQGWLTSYDSLSLWIELGEEMQTHVCGEHVCVCVFDIHCSQPVWIHFPMKHYSLSLNRAPVRPCIRLWATKLPAAHLIPSL